MPPNLPGLKFEETNDSALNIDQQGDTSLEGISFGEPVKDSPTSLTLPSEPKTEVGMIDTDSAITQVNDQKSFLDETFPENQFLATGQQLDATGQPIPSAEPPPPPEPPPEVPEPETESKATLVNEDGQKIVLTGDQLDATNINRLLDQGFVMEESENFVPGVEEDPELTRLQDANQQASTKVENLTQDFLDFNIESDPDFQAQATGIKAQFDKLRRNMERVNQARERAFETRAFRTGTARFAGDIAAGILGEEINQGGERLAEITRQENATLSTARSAFKDGKFLEFSRKVDALRDIRDQKAKALENYNQVLVDANKALADQEAFQLEKDKFAFEILKEEAKQAKVEIGTIAPGQSIFDKKTGEILGTAPEPVDTSAPEITKFNGQVHQWNPIKGTWDLLGSEDALGAEGSDAVIDWANQVASGARKFSDVPGDLKSAVNSAISKLPPKQEDVRQFQNKINILKELIKDPSLKFAVGLFGGRTGQALLESPLLLGSRKRIASARNFVGRVQQILSQEALQSLIEAKERGATFGALSDAELQILTEAATTIGNWTITKNGKVVGYRIDEQSFRDEFVRLIGKYETAIADTTGQEALGSNEQILQTFFNENPSQREAMENLNIINNPNTGKPFTEEEKIPIYEAMGITGFDDSSGFNNELQTSSKGSVLGLGQITAFGSPLWKHGLDIDLKIGDPVPSPVSGKVVFVGKNGGFGNQVRIETAKGNILWLSHLDGFDVKIGDVITKGSTIGKGGNTGRTIPGAGGDGSHLDLTVKKKDGTFFTPEEIFKKLA